jgi:hypothetical protein
LVENAISPIGDSDLYYFNGLAGDFVTVGVVRLEGNVAHCVRIIEPDGAIGKWNCAYTYADGGRDSGASVDQMLTTTGVHVIQVIGSENETFRYRIGIQCGGACDETAVESTLKVLPQIAFGGTWSSTLYFANTTQSGVSLNIRFADDSGEPLLVPAGGGTSTTINLGPNATALVTLPNVGPLVQGYVSVSMPVGIVAYGVVRKGTGQSNQEAVVPFSDVSKTAITLIWDDTDFVTVAAILNPTSVDTSVDITVRDMSGEIIGMSSVGLSARQKIAVPLRTLPGLERMQGNRGLADFNVGSGAIAIVGLRFTGDVFTSIPMAEK